MVLDRKVTSTVFVVLALLSTFNLAIEASGEENTIHVFSKCRVEAKQCGIYMCVRVEAEARVNATGPEYVVVYSMFTRLTRFGAVLGIAAGNTSASNNTITIMGVEFNVTLANGTLKIVSGNASATAGLIGLGCFETSCRILSFNASQPAIDAIVLSAIGYGAPRIEQLLLALAGLDERLGPVLNSIIGVILAPQPTAQGLTISISASRYSVTASLQWLLVYPPAVGVKYAERLLASGCTGSIEPRRPTVIALRPMVEKALHVLGGTDALEALEKGDAYLAAARYWSLCSKYVSDIIAGVRDPPWSSVVLAASLCASEPIDPHGILYRVDLVRYSSVLFLVSLRYALASGIPFDPDMLNVAVARGFRLPFAPGIDPENVPAKALLAFYYAGYALLGDVPPSALLIPLPYAPTETPEPVELMAKAEPLTSLVEAALPSSGGAVAPAASRIANITASSAIETFETIEEVRRILQRVRGEEAPGEEIFNASVRGVPRGLEALNVSLASRIAGLLEKLAEIVSEAKPPSLSGAVLPSASVAVVPSNPFNLFILLIFYTVLLLGRRVVGFFTLVPRVLRGLKATSIVECFDAVEAVLTLAGYPRMKWEGPLEYAGRLPPEVKELVEKTALDYARAVYADRLVAVESCAPLLFKLYFRALKARLRRLRRVARHVKA